MKVYLIVEDAMVEYEPYDVIAICSSRDIAEAYIEKRYANLPWKLYVSIWEEDVLDQVPEDLEPIPYPREVW